MFTTTPIKDLIVYQPKIFTDERGYFFESYNKKTLAQEGINSEFVQDNQSFSEYGVLRGLHYQCGEHAQSKLVRVLLGEILDVAVDIRPHSETYGQYFSIILSSENKKQLYIPKGFAHGFLVLSEKALFSYKCDNYYNKESEAGICYNDPNIGINWGIPKQDIIVNDRDKSFPKLKALDNIETTHE